MAKTVEAALALTAVLVGGCASDGGSPAREGRPTADATAAAPTHRPIPTTPEAHARRAAEDARVRALANTAFGRYINTGAREFSFATHDGSYRTKLAGGATLSVSMNSTCLRKGTNDQGQRVAGPGTSCLQGITVAEQIPSADKTPATTTTITITRQPNSDNVFDYQLQNTGDGGSYGVAVRGEDLYLDGRQLNSPTDWKVHSAARQMLGMAEDLVDMGPGHVPIAPDTVDFH